MGNPKCSGMGKMSTSLTLGLSPTLHELKGNEPFIGSTLPSSQDTKASDLRGTSLLDEPVRKRRRRLRLPDTHGALS